MLAAMTHSCVLINAAVGAKSLPVAAESGQSQLQDQPEDQLCTATTPWQPEKEENQTQVCKREIQKPD